MLLIKNNWIAYEREAVCLPPRLRADLDNCNTNTDLMHIYQHNDFI